MIQLMLGINKVLFYIIIFIFKNKFNLLDGDRFFQYFSLSPTSREQTRK